MTKINKTKARNFFNAGKTITLFPCNMKFITEITTKPANTQHTTLIRRIYTVHGGTGELRLARSWN